MAGSVHHYYGVAGSAGWNIVDSVSDAYNVERPRTDRRSDVHGSSNFQQYTDDFVCTRADGGRRQRSRSGGCGRLYANASRDHDGAGDEHRHGAYGAGLRGGRRAKRPAGTSGHRWIGHCDSRYTVLCSRGIQHFSWRTNEAFAIVREILRLVVRVIMVVRINYGSSDGPGTTN